MDARDQAFISDVQQRQARRFVNTTAFRFDDAVFDLVAHTQTMATTDAVGFHDEVDRVYKGFAVQRHGLAFFKAHTHGFSFDDHIVLPKRHAHDGVDDFDAAV